MTNAQAIITMDGMYWRKKVSTFKMDGMYWRKKFSTFNCFHKNITLIYDTYSNKNLNLWRAEFVIRKIKSICTYVPSLRL